jgi:hypothetical protein
VVYGGDPIPVECRTFEARKAVFEEFRAGTGPSICSGRAFAGRSEGRSRRVPGRLQ